LKIEHLTVQVGRFSLRDITLHVRRGEYFVLLGPTGAGKTVLLETIAGRYTPQAGAIWIKGVDVTQLKPHRRNVGYVPQDYALFPHLTVEENVLFGLRARKCPQKEMRARWEEMTGLLEIAHLRGRLPSSLSGGEKQRVALARALITRPELLLLDEPLTALDPAMQKRLWWELKRIHRRLGVTILHVTHNFQEALALAERVGVLNDGQLVQTGVPEEVFRKPRSPFVAEFVEVENMFRGTCVRREGERVRIALDGGVELWALSPKEGRVHVSIRPEDVLLGKEASLGQRNRLRGRVSAILNQGVLYQVVVDVGIPLTALVTRKAYLEGDLRLGMELDVAIKEEDVHVF